ncbi:response regulator [uncultured Treponema sp.]|uniref:response regulator n=1 Tax=uncultured Treponema sp. TaxID=162155 RepID=UPI0025DD3D5A|nr:response regulator [uncultured Treponema sp.]
MAQCEGKTLMYSALEVAKLCGVVNQTVINWIKNNHLKAFKTPGGQFRVYPKDLVEFMLSRNIQVPAELRSLCPNYSLFPNSLLIVDDDRGFNTVVARFMEKRVSSLSVFQAFDGFEAGSLMVEKQPDLVILDLDIPGIDGLDLCRRIQDTDRFGKPEIIVITALESDDLEENVKKLGIHSFLRKPIDLIKLAEIVQGIFKK